MALEIAEALLEMHFYESLKDLFESHFGRKVLRIIKPTQSREAFLGFDVAWVQDIVPASPAPRQTLTRIQQDLGEFIKAGAGYTPSVFLGYFLQFKIVEEITRKSKALPTGFQTPYYRSELSMNPNHQTGISQHETLLRLQNLPRTDVSYACPMILHEDDLHRPVNLEELRLVSVATAPSGYASNERHFIAFQDKRADPVWCSEPTPGKATPPREWVERLHPMTAEELEVWLRRLRPVLLGGERSVTGKAALPYALTLVALGEPTPE